jgi:transposase
MGRRGPPGQVPSAEFVAAVERAIEEGATFEIAAAVLGVTSRTLRNWRKQADEGDERYVPLTEAIERAEAVQQRDYLVQMREHARTEWRACAWLLERKWPARWGKATPQSDDTVTFDLPDDAVT